MNFMVVLLDGARAGIGWAGSAVAAIRLLREKQVASSWFLIDPQIGLIGPSSFGKRKTAGYSWFRMDNPLISSLTC